ncbi:hypothetical protein TIFTF001_020557 [Ficus carica]|uniref:Uncharacterized protein n=1 Tax=Ficus carica TaxID=3494 RepID=A0AA88AFY8_FICCA|nr:hypothetical protein TIFTF001_020557 [Ficus carica]
MASKYLSFSSSLVPSPLSQRHSPNNNNNNSSSPNKFKPTSLLLLRCSFSAPSTSSTSSSSSSSSSAGKKRHWKQGEYPGVSETFIPGISRKTPIKNVKKKLDRKNKAKAWVNTVTETLSERIQNKQWLQALQAGLSLSLSLSLYCFLSGFSKFLLFLFWVGASLSQFCMASEKMG